MDYSSGKRYLTYNQFLRDKFGTKVFKVSLNINTTCPNRDGKLGTGGCIFCSESGSGDFAGDKEKSIREQFIEIKNKLTTKWSLDEYKYIAYFQANTNTYTSVEKLKKVIDESLEIDDKIVGIALSTRPDCLSDEMVDFLGEVNKKTFLQIELGLQSVHNKTLEMINRGHSYECFDIAVKKLRSKNIDVVVHIINGLPDENKIMMLETVKKVVMSDIQGIKIHMLHVLENTKLAEYYKAGKVPIMSLEEYVELVVSQLEIIPNNIVIHRITGDGKKEDLLAPLWSLKKFVVMNEIDKLMRNNDTYQGKLVGGC